MVQAYTEIVGEFAKKQADQQYARRLFWSLTVVFIFTSTLAFLAGLSLEHRGVVAWMILGVVLVFLPGMFVVFRVLDHRMSLWRRRRISLLRGAQAEVYVSLIFRDDLDDQWHLFDNVKPDANSDFDHVLIGPGGFFVISTKSRRGRFQATSPTSDPVMNGEPVDWPRDAVRQALRLREVLPHYTDDPSAKVPYIQAVLCLPFAWIDTEQAHEGIDACGKCWVLHEDNLLDALAPDPLPKSRRLKPADITRWAAAVEKLHQRHASPTA